jgi:SAM-dependent methyltransferase
LRREIAGFLDSVQRRGVFVTLRLLLHEFTFDLRHGTTTHGVREGTQLGTLPDSLHGRHLVYHPVNPLVLRRCLDTLERMHGNDVWRATFVDFGCGAGRALIIAARHRFRRVVGIECASGLVEACERNLRASWRRFALRAEYAVHCSDATTFDLPDDSTVWLWFNPFDAVSARRVAERMIESLSRRPRAAYLVYAHPLQLATLLELGFETLAEVRLAPRHVDAAILRYPLAAPELRFSFDESDGR